MLFFIKELNRSQSLYKYTLIYKNNSWLIDKKEWYVEYEKKWEKHYI
ncbi:NTF2 fold immunity protein [Pasteurella sp. PK-2025]